VEADILEFLESTLDQAEFLARELEEDERVEVDHDRIHRDRL